jgi:Zn ribbon nucleic-acid-binding protein
MQKVITTLVFIAGAACSQAAQAQAIDVDGDVYLEANTGNSTAVAIGYRTRATNDAGSLISSRVRGNARARGSSRNQMAVAVGFGSSARTSIGTIANANTRGSASANGSARSATALSFAPGSSTCLAVGSVGRGGSRGSGHVGTAMVYDFGLFRRTRVRVGTSGQVC